MKGKVYFMGVGPRVGEPLTPEALRVLRAAEVVLHDGEVSQAVLDLIPAWTQVRNAGKSHAEPCLSQDKIHSLLIDAAREGHQVVRLKFADLPVAKSAGAEFEALEQAGVEFEVISGTAAAIGAAGSSH